MYLKKTPSPNGRIRLSIVDNYYDKTTKSSRQTTIESLGFLDELQKFYDDPIAYFSKRVEELNKQKKELQAPINFTFYNSDRLCVNDNFRKNFGYAALSKIYHELELHTFLINRQRHSKEQYDANTIMKLLVFSRLLCPSSKKSSFENRELFFEKTNYTLDDVYHCLSFLDRHKENLQIWMNDRIKRNYGRNPTLVYYDVTNYYFETDKQNDFLRKGVSKEHRPNPIVQMGLFIDDKGLPITYELFPGNLNDCLTYRPNFGRIKKQFALGRVISVADKGMTTGDNIWYTITSQNHDGYVFSISIRKASKSIKDYVLNEDGYVWLSKEYKRKSRKCPRTIYVSGINGTKLEKQVDEKQVVFWSEKYAKRARIERQAALAKAMDLVKNPGNYKRSTSYGAAKYVRKIDFDKETGEILTASSILSIDEDKIREDEALDGYYMLLTSEMDTPDDEIINIYRGLWRIEESFKVTKSELEARPVYVSTREHIEAHFLTCFVALTLVRILELKLAGKYSIARILESLSHAECSLLQQNYYIFDYYDETLKDIGNIFDIDFSKRIRKLDEIKKVIAKTKSKKTP